MKVQEKNILSFGVSYGMELYNNNFSKRWSKKICGYEMEDFRRNIN